MTTSAPITERRYVAPLILVTTLFFLWALGVNLNDVLIPHLKKVFDLNDFQSALIQVAFFGGYCLSALPAGRLLERIGYKNGIAVGLVTCAAGALLFIPAASIQVYGLFLFASFVMACGQGVLEVAANPYVTLLGPAESSERRLNLAQSFNAVGAVVTPFIGAAFILSALEYSREKLTAMTPTEMASVSHGRGQHRENALPRYRRNFSRLRCCDFSFPIARGRRNRWSRKAGVNPGRAARYLAL